MDLDHEMMELTLQIVGKTLFSADLSQGASDLVRATLTALDFVMFRAQNPFSPDLFLPSQRRRSFKQALHTLDSAVHRLIAERRSSGPKDDLLSMLLEARSDGGEAMSAVQLRDELITLIVAGHETVASSLTWTWYLIATHPQVEQTLHAELDSVLGGRTPTVEDLPLLPSTRAVVDESLRLYPPAWVITRRAIASDQIGPYTIPAGSLVITSPYVVHRQRLWSEPDSFKPQRFVEEAKLPRYAYIPFGGGPRLCIGNNFALMESQLILATLAQHYRLRLVEGKPVIPQGLVTIRPKGGLWMRLEGRK
jgi:cytochrome P450